LCESQDGLCASVIVLDILNLVITVAGNGMHVVEGSLVPVFPDGLATCLDVSASGHTEVLYAKITPGI
jgi:hypothetical protein